MADEGERGTSRVRRWLDVWRPSAVTLGAPSFPLFVLFGLNTVDELDRAAFAVLLPDIRDHFGLSDSAALAMVSVATIAVILIGIPLSFYADRADRVRIARVGASIWGTFSAATGFAFSVPSLVAARIGAGGGRAVVTPTHPSLLSDYYEPAARVKVFSVHQLGNSVGQILGPLLGGLLALWFGWRSPFIVFAVPTLVLVILSLRLKEPIRGALEGRAVAEDDADAPRSWAGARATMRALHDVRTIRRIWWAVPFLAITLFSLPNLLSLVYEDVFDLNSGARGAIAAGVEPLQIVGVFFAMPRVAAVAMRNPGFLLRFVAVVGVVDGILLVVLAYAPFVQLAVLVHALLAASIGTLMPAFLTLLSLVSPPKVRSAAFSTVAVFAIPGLAIILPLLGTISDTFGVQASFLALVPVTVVAGFVLASASRFVDDDINTNKVTEADVAVELAEGPTFL